MHFTSEIIAFIKNTYGVEVPEDEFVVQSIHRKLDALEPLTHEVFVIFAKNENHVNAHLLLALTRKLMNSTPSDWSLVPKFDNFLSSFPLPKNIPGFYQDLLWTLDKPGTVGMPERLHMFCQCINHNSVNWGLNGSKALPDPQSNRTVSVIDIIEKHFPQAEAYQPAIEGYLYYAMLNKKIYVKTATPWLINILRKGRVDDDKAADKLRCFADTRPELEMAATESFIFSNPPGSNIVPEWEYQETVLDFWSKYASDTLEWQRCAVALLLNGESMPSKLGRHALDTNDALWLKLKAQCDIYIELFGPPLIGREHEAVDAIMQQTYTPNPEYELPDIVENSDTPMV